MAAIRAFLEIHESLACGLGWAAIALFMIAFVRGATRPCDGSDE